MYSWLTSSTVLNIILFLRHSVNFWISPENIWTLIKGLDRILSSSNRSSSKEAPVVFPPDDIWVPCIVNFFKPLLIMKSEIRQKYWMFPRAWNNFRILFYTKKMNLIVVLVFTVTVGINIPLLKTLLKRFFFVINWINHSVTTLWNG